MSDDPPIQDCADCQQQPVLSCGMTGTHSTHEYNIGHRCPDGTVARGASGYYRHEVIQEWNRQQIRKAIKTNDDQG